MKRLAILLAVFIAAAALVHDPSYAVGRQTHHVVIAGHLRVLLPIGYENRLPFPRVPGEVPSVLYMAHVQASDTPDFSNVVVDTTLGGLLHLRDGLPAIVPQYDGFTDFGGTSGFYLLDVFEVRVRTAFESLGDQVYWRIAEDSATLFSQGFDTIDPRLGILDTSRVDVSGFPTP